MANESILITGGAGYVGSNAAKCLIDEGYSVIIIDDLSGGHHDFITSLQAPFYHSCISNKSLIKEIIAKHQISAVLHFAAKINVGESQKDPQKYFDNNVVKAIALLDAVVESGIRKFVFSSTCACYGNPIKTPIDEDHPLNPISNYGTSKLMVEQILKAYDLAYGLKSVIFRYFNACGGQAEHGLGEDHYPETHLIPLILAAAAGKNNELTIFGTDYPTPDGTCIRDYIHVKDLAYGHLLGLKFLEQGGGSEVFNLGAAKGFSVHEIIQVCEKVCQTKISMRLGPRRDGDPAVLLANTQKAKLKLGFDCRFSDIHSIVADAWQFYKKRYNN